MKHPDPDERWDSLDPDSVTQEEKRRVDEEGPDREPPPVDPLEDDERWSKNFEDTKDIHESDLEGV